MLLGSRNASRAKGRSQTEKQAGQKNQVFIRVLRAAKLISHPHHPEKLPPNQKFADSRFIWANPEDKGLSKDEQVMFANLRACVKEDRAPGTQKAYELAKANFIDWMAKKRWSAERDPDLLRCMYLAELVRSGRQKSAIVYTPALNYYFGPVKPEYKTLLGSVIEAAKRSKPAVRHREKVSEAHYELFIDFRATRAQKRTSILGVLLFRGMMRIGEALALEIEDIRVEKSNWVLKIAKSKTDQNREGAVRALNLTKAEEALLADYRLEIALLGWQFWFQNENKPEPLKYDYANKLLSERWKDLQIQCGYSSHSFRGGAATAAINNGIPSHQVKSFGRWSSELAFSSYIAPTSKLGQTNV